MAWTDAPTHGSSGSNKPAAQLCARCQTPTSRYCRGCCEAPNEQITSSKTFYCDAECQKADWSAHKTSCHLARSRCQLYRAAEILQAAFYLQRERIFDVSIAEIERKENTLHVFEGRYTPTQCLASFPYHLVSGKEEKEAVLSMLTCSDALAWMNNLIRRLFEGTRSKIEEAHVLLGKRRLHTIFYQGHNVRFPFDDRSNHVLLRVSLMGGEEYALDFTSAQHGYHVHVSPWQDYLQERVSAAALPTLRPLGTNKVDLDRGAMHKPGTIQEGIVLHHKLASASMDNTVKTWLTVNKITFKDLFSLPMDDFLRNKDNLLAAIDKDLIDFVKCVKKDGIEARLRAVRGNENAVLVPAEREVPVVVHL